MCIRTLLLANYIYLFLQIECKKSYARYWQLSNSYPHGDITLQLNKMKSKKMAIRCSKDSLLPTLLFNSLVNFLSSLFRDCQHVKVESDLEVYFQ